MQWQLCQLDECERDNRIVYKGIPIERYTQVAVGYNKKSSQYSILVRIQRHAKKHDVIQFEKTHNHKTLLMDYMALRITVKHILFYIHS